MKKVIMYLLVFIGIQMLGGGLGQLAWNLLKGQSELDATALVVISAIVNVVILVCFLSLKWAEVSRGWVCTRPWVVLFWCVLAALGAIIPSTYLQELIPELPNNIERELSMMMGNRYGYLILGLLAPLVEEIVFRGAILRALLSWRPNPWIGITISAVLFSVVHMNPAQMPHAFLIGLLLGWMYWRTGSIVPGVVYHWVNNTVAYVLYAFYPNPDIKLIDIFSGHQQTVLMAVGFSLLIFLPALFQLNMRMRRQE